MYNSATCHVFLEGNARLAFGIAFSLILSSKARDTCGQSRRRSSFHRTLCLTPCVKHHEISRATSCMSCCSVGSWCSSNKAPPSFAVLGVFVGSCNIILGNVSKLVKSHCHAMTPVVFHFALADLVACHVVPRSQALIAALKTTASQVTWFTSSRKEAAIFRCIAEM